MGSVRVPYLLEPELNLLNLNLWSSSRFSKFPGLNPRFGSRFSKILQEPDRPGPRHHYEGGSEFGVAEDAWDGPALATLDWSDVAVTLVGPDSS